jgi:hypothetical protein
MSFSSKFPHLYECSKCGGPVKVKPQGPGVEPKIERACGHDDATVWANRKVTLYGKGHVNVATRVTRKITLTVRQLLSAMLGRSI